MDKYFNYGQFLRDFNDCIMFIPAKTALEIYDDLKPYLKNMAAGTEKYEEFSKWLREIMWRVQVESIERSEIWSIISVFNDKICWIAYGDKTELKIILDDNLPKVYYRKETFRVSDEEKSKNSANRPATYRLLNSFKGGIAGYSSVEEHYALTGSLLFEGYATEDDTLRKGIHGFEWN